MGLSRFPPFSLLPLRFLRPTGYKKCQKACHLQSRGAFMRRRGVYQVLLTSGFKPFPPYYFPILPFFPVPRVHVSKHRGFHGQWRSVAPTSRPTDVPLASTHFPVDSASLFISFPSFRACLLHPFAPKRFGFRWIGIHLVRKLFPKQKALVCLSLLQAHLAQINQMNDVFPIKSHHHCLPPPQSLLCQHFFLVKRWKNASLRTQRSWPNLLYTYNCLKISKVPIVLLFWLRGLNRFRNVRGLSGY